MSEATPVPGPDATSLEWARWYHTNRRVPGIWDDSELIYSRTTKADIQTVLIEHAAARFEVSDESEQV